MASQDLKQRFKDDAKAPAAVDGKSKMGGKISNRRMAMAKRGLRSLTIAVTLPLSLSLLSAYLGSGKSRASVDPVADTKPFWFPPMWALHLTCPASCFLMGLAAWMVWADGGFHRHPNALLFYLAQLLLTLLWDPLVFGAGATRIGLILCFGMFAAMVGCYRLFGQVNPISGDLIKPCLAWTAFLSLVNLKLVFV
ncbi:translocator protein homolog [Prosopis cineraria]|uniref:translocator protein homolog n=1 Tax=Prosopis cineraria TaxID=364024 RepID=UPI00240EF5FA|nr:translocator protein homolog [Prosopis cineraria]